MLALIMTKSSNYFLSLLSVIFISLILCKELKVKRRLIDIFTKEGKLRNVLIFMKELLIGSGREKENLSSERFPVNHKIRIITKEDIKYWFLGNFICIIAGFSIIFYLFFLGKFNMDMANSFLRNIFVIYSILYIGPFLGALILKLMRKDMPWYLYGTVWIIFYVILSIFCIKFAFISFGLEVPLGLTMIFNNSDISCGDLGTYDSSIELFFGPYYGFFYVFIVSLIGGITADIYRLRKMNWRVIIIEEIQKSTIKENFKYLFWGVVITLIAEQIFFLWYDSQIYIWLGIFDYFYYILFLVVFLIKCINPDLSVHYYASIGLIVSLFYTFLSPFIVMASFLGGAIVDIYRYFKFKNSPYYE